MPIELDKSWEIKEDIKTLENNVEKRELDNIYRKFDELVEELNTNIAAHNKCIDEQNNKIGNMYSNFIIIIITLLSVGIVFISVYGFIVSIVEKAIDNYIHLGNLTSENVSLLITLWILLFIIMCISIASLIKSIFKSIRTYLLNSDNANTNIMRNRFSMWVSKLRENNKEYQNVKKQVKKNTDEIAELRSMLKK
ncbi:MAG: hypothetical protein ACK5K7_07540 [Bacilli bacterium]